MNLRCTYCVPDVFWDSKLSLDSLGELEDVRINLTFKRPLSRLVPKKFAGSLAYTYIWFTTPLEPPSSTNNKTNIGQLTLSTAPSQRPVAQVGFGRAVSHALVEGVAQHGRGAAEFVVDTSEMETKLGDGDAARKGVEKK